MKKTLVTLLSIIIITAAYGQGFTVKKLHVDIDIHTEGYFDVTENYDVDFTEEKHGLWRKIPYKYLVRDENGAVKEVTVIINNVDVPGWRFKKSKEGDYVSLKIGDAKKYVTGRQQYTIQYRVKYAFLYNKSNTQFYWNFLGKEWAADFEKVTYNIHLPTYLPLTAGRDFFAYTGAVGDTTNKSTMVYTHGVISGEVNETLGNGKDLTVLINLPAGYIMQPGAWQTFYDACGYLLYCLALVIAFYILWRMLGKDNKVVKVVEFQPPVGIDPAMAGFLINDRSDAHDLIAFIPHWGAYGYITVEHVEKKGIFGHSDTILHKLKPLPANAPEYERIFFSGLFGANDEVSLNSLKNTFYTTMDDAKAKLKNTAMGAGYYIKGSNNWGCMVSLALLVIGVAGYLFISSSFGQLQAFVWAAVCFILICCSGIFLKRSASGDEAMRHVTGFKMFIDKADKDRLAVLLKDDPGYFEKTMGYALAFGMLTTWGRKFDGLDVIPPVWYTGYSHNDFTTHGFSESFGSAMSSAQTNLVSTPSSSSSSSSGGGGSSGGGFGGGGGGSW